MKNSLTLKEQKLLEQICQASQKTLYDSMRVYLMNLYKEVIVDKDYLIALGSTSIGLVAHLDTVFPERLKEIYYDKDKEVMWSPTGLGADDRAGIYSIYRILKAGYRPTVILTTDEELGNQGAIALSVDVPSAPTSLKYLIELDRQGQNDCVFYDCENPDFSKYIESFGFKTARGTFSDISDICPYWGIAGVNLSIGYYNEHTPSETLHIRKMLDTIEKVQEMIEDVDNISTFGYYSTKKLWEDIKCAGCGKVYLERFLNKIQSPSGELKYYCLDCAVNLEVDYCPQCHDLFSNPGGKEKVCPICRNSLTK